MRGIRQERLVATGLALAMAASAALILWETRGLTFWSDEWTFLQDRRTFDPGTLLEPFNGHLMIVPLCVYNALFSTVGADSYVPFRLVMVGLVLLCAGLFFLLARRRVGGPIALVPTVLLLFFGASWDVIASPTAMPALCSIAAGLGALVALDRRDWNGDILACLLLAVSLASLSYGIAFAVGMAVEVLRRPGRERWRSSWIFFLPASLYATWALWALRFDQSQLRIENIGTVPTSMADSMAGVVAAMTGLFRVPAETGVDVPFRTDWGELLAVPLAIVIVVRIWRGGASARFLAVLAMALALWASFAMVLGPVRGPAESRYLYPGAILLLLLIVELARGVSVSRMGLAVLTAVLAIALIGNIAQLHDGANRLRIVSDVNRAELAGLELARDHVDSGFRPEGPGTLPPAEDNFLERVVADSYFSAVDDAGSPAYSITELRGRPETTRRAADIVLARALRLEVRPVPRLPEAGNAAAPAVEDIGNASAASRGGCVELRPKRGGGSVTLRVPQGGLTLQARPGPAVLVELRRFAGDFAAPLDRLPGGSDGILAIPTDPSRRPWIALLRSRDQPVRACGAPVRA